MHVLHIIPTLGMGGAEKLLVDSLKYYKKQGITCTVAVLTHTDNVYGESMKDQGIELVISKENSNYSAKNILFIKKIIEERKYDIVHCHLYAAQLFTPIALMLCSYRPVLVTTEHSTSNRRRKIPIFKFLDKKMYKAYDQIICISDATKQALSNYLPILGQQLIVIENGIDAEPFQTAGPISWENELENYQYEKIVLMVASLRKEKDPFTLIKAAQRLGSNYRVVFVGEGVLLQEAQDLVRDGNINNVSFLGKRKDVPSLMKAADVFVLSSHWEGFGLVVVEAAAAGLPIIASDVPGLREIVLSIGGQLFETQNDKALAHLIQQAEHKQTHFDSRYIIENMVSKYIDVYKASIEL